MHIRRSLSFIFILTSLFFSSSSFALNSKAGDILVREGAFGIDLLAHTALDLGDGYVMEFTGGTNSAQVAQVSISKISDFIAEATNGQRVYVYEVPAEKSRPVNEVLACAYNIHRYDPFKAGYHKGYDPLYNNCQHFVTLCKTGERYSWQAEHALTAASHVQKYVSDKNAQRAKKFYNLVSYLFPLASLLQNDD